MTFSFSIVNLSVPLHPVFVAQSNPHRVVVTKQVDWAKAATSFGDQPELTFSSANGRVLQCMLEFDTSETGDDVDEHYVRPLTRLAMIINPTGPVSKRLPPLITVKWSPQQASDFTGVIVSVNASFTAFSPDGTPIKASCELVVTEASRATFRKN